MGESKSIIACFYDCDQTLIAEYMQNPMLRQLGIDPDEFWADNDRLKEKARADDVDLNSDLSYMNNILLYIRKGKIPPLSNADLYNYGALITAYPGLPDFFLRTKKEVQDRYEGHDIKLEHYIISTGLRKIIQGSCLNAPGALDRIFASEFLEDDGVISLPARNLGHVEKTRYLYEANKGANVNPTIDVNKRMSPKKRRIYFKNMIYVGDGFTDVPCMAMTLERGGISIGVYDPTRPRAYHEVQQLKKDNRILYIAQTNYRPEGEASKVIERSITQIAERIIKDKR